MTSQEAFDRALEVMLPNATEFQKIALRDAMSRAGDLTGPLPREGTPEYEAVCEVGALVQEALGWTKPPKEEDA